MQGKQSSIPTAAGTLMDGLTSGGPRPFPALHNTLGGTLIEWWERKRAPAKPVRSTKSILVIDVVSQLPLYLLKHIHNSIFGALQHFEVKMFNRNGGTILCNIISEIVHIFISVHVTALSLFVGVDACVICKISNCKKALWWRPLGWITHCLALVNTMTPKNTA